MRVGVTAADVVYTLEGQRNNPALPYHSDFNQFVQEVQATDDHTVMVTFQVPAPRFKFEVLTLKFDTGIPIVPAHVLSKQADVNEFSGGFDMPHSGPYSVVAWDANQKVLDLRPDWWAIKAGRIPEPAVKRVVIRGIDQTRDTLAMRIVNGEYDSTLDLRGLVIRSIVKQNPKIITHTGDAPPYGYLDWWTNSLWMNTQQEPYNDARMRRALSLAIDRDQPNDLIYEGAAVSTIHPFPLYPGLERFLNSEAVKALQAKYEPGKFDLAESARLLTEAGFVRNADGLWSRNGETINATINGFEFFHDDVALVLVEMLRAAGFNASVYFGVDAFQNMTDGKPGLYLFGHGGSLTDPYATLELFHSRHSEPAGTPAGVYFSRYQNPEYDAILDRMAVLSTNDPEFEELAAQALEIYWREVIDIPVIQWLHHISYNETYWVNWPTQENPAMGTNGAFWAHTGMLVVTGLKSAQ